MEKKSKSQVKREMSALQKLGERLTHLSADQIKTIEMPEDLREAVLFAQTLKKGARCRQMQYIGVLMREADSEPIRQALDNLYQVKRSEAQAHAQIEKWRDELVAGNDELLHELLNRFPDLDERKLRRLILDAGKEKERNKPPKSSRALFRYLRDLPKPFQEAVDP